MAIRDSANLPLIMPASSSMRQRPSLLSGIELENRWIPEDEIGGFFASADVVVAPYTEASQSGVIATAFAAGVPVVATPVGGLAEQVRHRVTGIVTETVDASGVANGIRALLEDRTLYERCAQGASEEAESRLSWAAVASAYTDVLQRVAQSPLRRGR